MTTATVYTWLRPGMVDALIRDSKSYSRPTQRQAVQVWADELLRSYAEREGLSTTPPLTLRRHAIFCWPGESAPEPVQASNLGRLRVRLEVESSGCASARMDLLNPLLAESGWRKCIVDLVDRGFDETVLAEELSFLQDARAMMSVADGPAALQTTDPSVIDAVLGHFQYSLRGYLDSWSPFVPARILHPLTEVLCPPESLLQVTPDPNHGN